MAILSEIVGFGTEIVGIFKGFQPTPEEQQAKAGVWYRMLQDLVTNDRTAKQLADLWKDQFPFKQKRTINGFYNSLLNKDRNQLIDILVGKINDELIKGGFSPVTRQDVLSGMGLTDLGGSKVGSGVVNAGVSGSSPLDVFAPDENKAINESRIYFYVGGLLLLVTGVIVWMFWNNKPKRRRY